LIMIDEALEIEGVPAAEWKAPTDFEKLTPLFPLHCERCARMQAVAAYHANVVVFVSNFQEAHDQVEVSTLTSADTRKLIAVWSAFVPSGLGKRARVLPPTL